MLRTEDQSKHPISVLGSWNGETIWRSISLDLNVPYFLLGFVAREGSLKLDQTVMLWEVDQLLEHYREVILDKTKTLTQVALMCPRWMTDDCGWQMANLSEIRKVQIRKNMPSVFVYITADGRELTNSKTKFDINRTISNESVLAISAI